MKNDTDALLMKAIMDSSEETCISGEHKLISDKEVLEMSERLMDKNNDAYEHLAR